MHNDTVNLASRKVGSLAIFTCQKGLEFEGSGVRQCLPHGTWSGNHPTCKDTREMNIYYNQILIVGISIENIH